MSPQTLQNNVLGTGWGYPFGIDPATGSVYTSSGDNNVKDCMTQILDVVTGEWRGRRRFGSNLLDLVFLINDPANDGIFRHYVIEAMERWEPRIVVTAIQLNRNDELRKAGIIELYVEFYIVQTNTADNLVYPYYVESI